MKKTLIITAISSLIFFACKKDRTCTCTNTEISRSSTQPGYTYTPQPATTSKTTYEKVKKGNVNSQLCVSDESTYTYNSSSWNGTTTVNYVVTVNNKSECELTK